MKTKVNQIGAFAQQVLERSGSGLVSGIASRGIYLQPRGDWTLYLSLEEFRGPLSLNLADGSMNLSGIKAGSGVLLSTDEIRFEEDKLIISLEGGSIWHHSGKNDRVQLNPEQLDSMPSRVNEISPDNPYLPLLSDTPDQIPGASVILDRIQKFQGAFRSGIQEQIEEGSLLLLGLGPGLTPLGDDFLLGVLLTLNRWGVGLDIPQDLIENINRVILDNSPIKTTQISSSLFSCAVKGAADERLLKVLDGLCSGDGVQQNDLKNLLRWGKTSGITVLAGMVAVLSNYGSGTPPGLG